MIPTNSRCAIALFKGIAHIEQTLTTKMVPAPERAIADWSVWIAPVPDPPWLRVFLLATSVGVAVQLSDGTQTRYHQAWWGIHTGWNHRVSLGLFDMIGRIRDGRTVRP